MIKRNSCRSMKFPAFLCYLLFLAHFTLAAQQETEGVLILQEPGSTFTEALEYRSYQPDNALFVSVVTTKGERKKMKAAAVIAAVPYPPLSFDPTFEDLTQISLQKINQLETRYPRVRSQLEGARSRWERALAVFHENRTKSVAAGSKPTTSGLPRGARLTSATADSATVTHNAGVRTYPLSDLNPAQVLALNATSRVLQLPLGIQGAPSAADAKIAESSPKLDDATQWVETSGRHSVAYFAKTLRVSDRTFSVWTFFVLLPALVLVLLVALIVMIRREAITTVPERRPLA